MKAKSEQMKINGKEIWRHHKNAQEDPISPKHTIKFK